MFRWEVGTKLCCPMSYIRKHDHTIQAWNPCITNFLSPSSCSIQNAKDLAPARFQYGISFQPTIMEPWLLRLFLHVPDRIIPGNDAKLMEVRQLFYLLEEDKHAPIIKGTKHTGFERGLYLKYEIQNKPITQIDKGLDMFGLNNVLLYNIVLLLLGNWTRNHKGCKLFELQSDLFFSVL